MGMSSKRFQLLCATLLGVGHLFIMTSYEAESFLLESVIHSIHEREPQKIDPYAGYYGQAVLYFGYMVACIFSPSVLSVTNPKTTLFLSACCFTAFPIGFLFTNSYYYYFSCVVLGIGFALFYQGHGGYIMSHSTRKTISSNISISWSIGACCLFMAAAVMAGTTKISADQSVSLNITGTGNKFERRFSDLEITLLFASLTVICFVGCVVFLLIPSEDVENCIESSEKRGSFVEALKLTCQTLVSPRMIQLIPLFALGGVSISFWISIFPTSMNFNMHISHMIYLPAIYSFGSGISEVAMAITISTMSKKFKDFGLQPTMLIGSIFTTIYCMMILVSTPYDAAMRPTNEKPLLFHQNGIYIFILSLVIGISDCCINNTRGVICAVVMPERRAQATSVSKFYQALVSCIIYFLSPHLNIYYYTIGIPILAIFATVLFFHVARKTQRMERKLTIEQNKKSITDFVETVENSKC